ncbi:hypothetical protein NZD88_20655 [Chryseobacterium antibioticum]|uniref:DUF6876 domain-containing protein n=1 Tax=Chryseobacterium pyrolae TaxID=2987481 RepID=A0ABT2INN4_9FLAO|nr:DUF6876 family protein [Chryseobacterium pyrolae]MCT2409973.1 hypothetical protein [Chryseobacterium pyrolae]
MMNKHNSKIRNSANDLYNIYTSREKLHEYKNGFKLTEGIYDIAVYEDCFSLIDLILEQQCGPKLEIQIWELIRREENAFNLTCSNVRNEILYEKNNLRIDFYFDYLQIFKIGKLLCLPIEKDIY